MFHIQAPYRIFRKAFMKIPTAEPPGSLYNPEIKSPPQPE
jgi:hypothetical protein